MAERCHAASPAASVIVADTAAADAVEENTRTVVASTIEMKAILVMLPLPRTPNGRRGLIVRLRLAAENGLRTKAGDQSSGRRPSLCPSDRLKKRSELVRVRNGRGLRS